MSTDAGSVTLSVQECSPVQAEKAAAARKARAAKKQKVVKQDKQHEVIMCLVYECVVGGICEHKRRRRRCKVLVPRRSCGP